jgi:CheY-like chemotaxis protein
MAELKTILLAEDNPNDVELTLTALAKNGISNHVDVVSDGAEALDYLHRRGKYASRTSCNPCVVLLDMKMPKVDGIEVLRDVKSSPALRTIPVVMLTSSREERDIVESYHLGVNGYVVKPIDLQEFFKAVREVGLYWAVINQPPEESALAPQSVPVA